MKLGAEGAEVWEVAVRVDELGLVANDNQGC